MESMNISSSMLPPGFRFHPTDQELIVHYLKNKLSSSPTSVVSIIADVDIYKFNPWELPGKASFGESEWFFFSPRDRKYPNGVRPNRAAASGYWKASGADKPIISSNGAKCLGVKKALAFYQGRSPKGVKTNWMMLEYRLIDDTSQSPRLRGSTRLDDCVLCRVRQKSKNAESIIRDYKFNGSISSFTSGCLQGQDQIMNENDSMEGSLYDQLQASNLLLPPIVMEGADGEQRQGQVTFHTESPENSAYKVSSNREVLESIKKILSLGALDELVPPLPTNASSVINKSKNNFFQMSSPTTSASNPSCFPGFIY